MLTFLWYDNFGEKGRLQSYGMAAIPKMIHSKISMKKNTFTSDTMAKLLCLLLTI